MPAPTRQFRAAPALCTLILLSQISSSAPRGADPPRAASAAPGLDLGAPKNLSPGVALFRLTDPGLLTPPAPVSIWLLRVDPAAADVRPALATDEIVDTETVAATASRHQAIAAINAGFFELPLGDPSGVYKFKGQLVSDTRRPRGAVGFLADERATRLVFGQLAASMRMYLRRGSRPAESLEIAAVDARSRPGRLQLFTPAYDARTDAPAGSREWVVRGQPLRVAGAVARTGASPIPPDGFVLSFAGARPPPPLLASLRRGAVVELETHYAPVDGRTDEWARAEYIVGGAGLLVRDGQEVTDLTMERLAPTFTDTRHPRTLIGTARDGAVWLITVDGRQPGFSAGMTLDELRGLVRRLDLINALNLDGGGSTTMWARGEVVNSPSDPAGPRKVSDALLVFAR